MLNSGKSLIQAMEWKKGCLALDSTAGPASDGKLYKVEVLHCVTDGTVTAHFGEGDETGSFTAGDDVVLDQVDITILTGTFSIN